MTKKLHVVLSCTNRKRRPADPQMSLRDLPAGPRRQATWLSRVRAAQRELVVDNLYAGEFWAEGQVLRSRAAEDYDVDGWVISAGLGLVNVKDRAPSYQATFATGHPDSVVVPGSRDSASVQRRRWWRGLREASASGPRQLVDLGSIGTNSLVVVCAGVDYVDAARDDLLEVQVAVGADRLLIFTSSTPGPDLEDSWVHVPGAVRTSLGGSMASTSVRACVAALGEDALKLEAARETVARIVRSGDPLPKYDRKRLDDDEIRAWIVSFLATSQHGTKSVALRDFRESGRACEQGRFGRLFEEASR